VAGELARPAPSSLCRGLCEGCSEVRVAERGGLVGQANPSEVSGDLARHARLKGDPPRRTMTLGEARQLIGALVTRWLAWLQESSNA
jgi:hypothetical protein